MDTYLRQFKFRDAIKISWKQIDLQLRQSFNTAHTSTNVRYNFLVVGYGEAGLPPKKPQCYLADIHDCFEAMNCLNLQILNVYDKEQQGHLLLQSSLLENYFVAFKQDQPDRKSLFLALLAGIRKLLTEPTYRACVSALQFCLFDLWAKLLNQPLSTCIYPTTNHIFKSYFTVSINKDIAKMVAEGRQAQKITPFIKIKLDNDVAFTKSVLKEYTNQKIGQKYVLDANASWTKETAIQIYQFLKQQPQTLQKIYCIEQPFPVNPNIQDWTQVHQIYKEANIKLMADESFAVLEDIDKLKPLVDGVNIKIQKIGGLINAVAGALECGAQGMKVWIGTMISSQLGCTQAYQLHPFAEFGDLDGGLLTVSPFADGFSWDHLSGTLKTCEGNGLAVHPI